MRTQRHLIFGLILTANFYAWEADAAKTRSARSSSSGQRTVSLYDASEYTSRVPSSRFNLGGQISPSPYFTFWGLEATGHFNVARNFDVGFESGLMLSFPSGYPVVAIPILASTRYHVIPMSKKFSFNIGMGLGVGIGITGVGSGLGFMADLRPVLGYDRFYLAPKLAFGDNGLNFAGVLGVQI
jgi:hypothetical protein